MSKPILNSIFGVLYAALIFIVIGCGENIEDPYPPEPPNWVEKSAPEDEIEKGIDADPMGTHIVLEWLPNLEDDLSGYLLYRAEESPDNDFTLLADLNIFKISGTDTFYIDEDLAIGVDYYYYLKAYDQAGNRSARSDTINYSLIPKVELVSPTGLTSSCTPFLKWANYSSSCNEYVIRVENLKNLKVVWIFRKIRTNYGDFTEEAIYNCDGSAYQERLSPGESYRWRVDAISEYNMMGVETAGSESHWGYITIEE